MSYQASDRKLQRSSKLDLVGTRCRKGPCKVPFLCVATELVEDGFRKEDIPTALERRPLRAACSTYVDASGEGLCRGCSPQTPTVVMPRANSENSCSEELVFRRMPAEDSQDKRCQCLSLTVFD